MIPLFDAFGRMLLLLLPVIQMFGMRYCKTKSFSSFCSLRRHVRTLSSASAILFANDCWLCAAIMLINLCEGDSRSAMNFSGAESFADYDGADENSVMKSGTDCDPKSFTDSSKLAEFGGFVNIFQKLKSTVVDMVSNLSGFMQNLFGVQGGGGVLLNPDGTARVGVETAMHASFMGLAVIAILVILLKRAS